MKSNENNLDTLNIVLDTESRKNPFLLDNISLY